MEVIFHWSNIGKFLNIINKLNVLINTTKNETNKFDAHLNDVCPLILLALPAIMFLISVFNSVMSISIST